MDRHPSYSRRPGQFDRPHTRRTEKRLGKLNKVVSKVFQQSKQEVAWRLSATSDCSHPREFLYRVQSIYFRTGVTVIMTLLVNAWRSTPWLILSLHSAQICCRCHARR